MMPTAARWRFDPDHESGALWETLNSAGTLCHGPSGPAGEPKADADRLRSAARRGLLLPCSTSFRRDLGNGTAMTVFGETSGN
jgi:hypothetical protein